jgi:replicative DNA helicase
MSAMSEALDFSVASDRLPPQNIDAEESILGGILLDPEAMNRVVEILTPEAFYLSAHQIIFEAARELYGRGNPTDLLSVTTWLKDRDLLEKVGGPQKLSQLLDRTVSAVNIDRYALLIAEKYVRRQLITAGGDIAQLAFNNSEELAKLLDRAEQRLFNITQSKAKNDLTSAEVILSQAFFELENRALESQMPGLSSGFYDLDAMTQGFQRSDLIIVAGRPSMGKTSFVMNTARNVAAIHSLPVAIFSLEMSKEQLMYRMLSSEAQIESNRLRSGRISENEWGRIGAAIQGLSNLKLYIDDTADISITEIRSKARRLQAERGGALGLIIIDYLQLMEGSGDNRVQELSKITRSLKALARELNVPILALSQLSRSVESRTNKRPMMSDLRESGSIEQDADLILMLYREEYYNPDTPDRGIAEVILTKHRNGPTGVVRLLFDSQFTQFKNMAGGGGGRFQA